MKINVFLPCKKSSSRVKNKNKRKFADVDFGLIKIKLNQLLKCKNIDNIFLSTNDMEIVKFAKGIKNKKIIIHKRIDPSLSKSSTITQKLINHAMNIIPDGHILWTHVTSPFVDEKIYDKVIFKYKKLVKLEYDSLLTVTKLKGFIWNDTKPVNYNQKKAKWPKTQETNALNRVNSAIFINSKKNYIKYSNRIGKRPYLYELSRLHGLDIDEFADFYFAEYIFKNKRKFLKNEF